MTKETSDNLKSPEPSAVLALRHEVQALLGEKTGLEAAVGPGGSSQEWDDLNAANNELFSASAQLMNIDPPVDSKREDK